MHCCEPSLIWLELSKGHVIQRENALEDPLVAKGRQLGRQLASALEAQRAKRATPTAVSVLDKLPLGLSEKHSYIYCCMMWRAVDGSRHMS